ncbi:OmpA family protein [Pinibacter soli]|uniref:OmpA family protein n=1 Tax=Pinibacter soli TaxID=3044211 RepID=A0ABT6RCP8_9BACT|nr:OmpA family protein [Pinibacter soli]MDI3320336.1 OmpA family protein [Pinibacter soli]
MKRLFSIAVFSIISVMATAQEEQNHPLPHIDTAVNIDSMLVKQRQKIDSTPVNVNPEAKPFITKLKTKPASDSARSAQESDAPQKSYDDRWFISPGLRVQVQDYSLANKGDHSDVDGASAVPFGKKTNASIAVSVYRNLSKRFSVSGDIGLSFGHVATTTANVTKTESKTYNVVTGTMYYHLLEDKNKLQPFISAGVYHLAGDAPYTSAPLGGGVKYHGNGMMVTAQVAYAYSISTNIKNMNPMMYSIGIYLPFKGKKKPTVQETIDNAKTQEKKKDTTTSALAMLKKGSPFGAIPNISILIMMPPFEAKGKKGRNGIGGDNGVDDGGISQASNKTDVENAFNYPPLTKYTIYFNYDLGVLTSGAFGVLDQVVYQLKTNDNMYVDLLGYTDLKGSEVYNQELSKKRAQVAFDYLKSRGIPDARMFMNYFGKDNPVVNTNDPNAAWRNRRTEIVIYEKK